MKKMILGSSLLTMMSLIPLPTMAGLHIDIPAPPSIHIGVPAPPNVHINLPAPPNISVNIPMPPHIQFSAPPRLVVVPETYVYVAPDVEEEIFFSDGWWYRPWEGRWYRSRHHNSGWQHYKKTPSFYSHVPHDWRNDYREGHWRGQKWNSQPISHIKVQKNWRGWKENKHWEKNRTWGVENLHRQKESRRPSKGGEKKHSNRGNNNHGNQR
ncbi:MAG: hypothetical protein KJ630_07875 [Proteobacteria bacterium]|nr:hypothetical protein [Pseudomonadota bacterium]